MKGNPKWSAGVSLMSLSGTTASSAKSSSSSSAVGTHASRAVPVQPLLNGHVHMCPYMITSSSSCSGLHEKAEASRAEVYRVLPTSTWVAQGYVGNKFPVILWRGFWLLWAFWRILSISQWNCMILCFLFCLLSVCLFFWFRYIFRSSCPVDHFQVFSFI